MLTLFMMGFFGAAHGRRGKWERKKDPLPKVCLTYPRMMQLGSYILSKEDPKNVALA